MSAATTFVSYITKITAAWLNAINGHVYTDTPVDARTGVHAASTIINTPAGNIAATDVQTALDELDTEKTNAATLAASGGAGVVGFTPYRNISSTEVQTAIQEEIDDLAASSGSSLVGFIQSGAGAVARTLSEKGLEQVSVKDYGAVGDGVTNDYPAFVSAMAANQSGVTPYFQSGEIKVPSGTYYMAGNTLTLTSQVKFVGEGSGQEGTGKGRSTLKWDADTVGVTCIKALAGTPGGDLSMLEGIYLLGGGGVGAIAHGIDMQARMVLRDVLVSSFRGNGINIVASSVNNQNANNWRMDTVTCDDNHGHGVYVAGTDANAGLATGISCSRNGGWGIYDSSFLGSSYVGCHTSSNTLGPYKSDNANARNIFLGCYSESNQNPSELLPPAMAVGGLHAAGFTATSAAWIVGASAFGGLQFGSMSGQSSDALSTISFGYSPSGQATSLVEIKDGANVLYRLKHATGRIFWDWANAGGSECLSQYDRNSVTVANGYSRDISGWSAAIPVGLPNGYFDAGMKARMTAAAAPIANAWINGDYIKNSAPAVGQPKGWYCTVSGTPGTWVSEGNL